MNETQALEIVKPGAEMQVARRDSGPLSLNQVQAGLKAIHEVMANCMAEGQDYGKVPGCGDKPSLFQPGAQKLSMMFQLNPEFQEEVVTDYPNMHRGYRLTIRVSSGGKFAEGVGECSTLESKYRYKSASRTCPNCGNQTIFKSKNPGDGFYCWQKKGGCGAKFASDDKSITDQKEGRTEHENPPDFWNTARKMAFKRGFVHAIINATNTSELWSQDLEDLSENGTFTDEKRASGHYSPQKTSPAVLTQTPPKATAQPAQPKNQPAAVPGLATEAHRKRLIEILTPLGKSALEYCQKSGMLLPTEELDDLPLRFVPATKEQKDDFMVCVQSFVDGGEANKPAYAVDDDDIPMDFPKEQSTGGDISDTLKRLEQKAAGNRIVGLVQTVSEKPGTGKNGKPYVKVGVKIADGWLNSFDTKIAEQCREAKENGLAVDIEYKDTKFGREIVSCMAVTAGEVTP